jgi:hypothetical protein
LADRRSRDEVVARYQRVLQLKVLHADEEEREMRAIRPQKNHPIKESDQVSAFGKGTKEEGKLTLERVE